MSLSASSIIANKMRKFAVKHLEYSSVAGQEVKYTAVWCQSCCWPCVLFTGQFHLRGAKVEVLFCISFAVFSFVVVDVALVTDGFIQ